LRRQTLGAGARCLALTLLGLCQALACVLWIPLQALDMDAVALSRHQPLELDDVHEGQGLTFWGNSGIHHGRGGVICTIE
jgi:hypothetical protein